MMATKAGEVRLTGPAPRIDVEMQTRGPTHFPHFARHPTRGRRPIANGEQFKRAIDIVLAVLLITFIAPVFLVLMVTVRLDGGPAFFRQRRVGRGGRDFECLKFRTMVVDAEQLLHRMLSSDPALAAEWANTQKLRRDPRVTSVGRILRATSMDELPQLLNVLRGEMSLVGPRPVLRQEYDDFYIPLGGAAAYLSVRPGLTGLWQVSGRSDVSYHSRVALDVTYTQTMSLAGDLRILARTVSVVLRREGAW